MQYQAFLLVVISIILASGCASGPPASERTAVVDLKVVDGPATRMAEADDANPDDVICERKRMAGSHFYRTVCKTRRQIEAERRNAESQLRRVREQNAVRAMH